MRKIFINASAAIAGFLVVLPLPALAAIEHIELEPISGQKGQGLEFITNLAWNIVDWLLALAGALAIAYLIWGGIQYITGGAKGAESAKGAIINAVIGIAIITLALVIVNVVETLLTKSQ